MGRNSGHGEVVRQIGDLYGGGDWCLAQLLFKIYRMKKL